MKKNYVIDTSVLAYDPNSIAEFKGNDVVIPITVLDELDKLKSGSNTAGKNARIFIRQLDTLCDGQDVTKGIKIHNNITLFIDTTVRQVLDGNESYGDNRILASAYAFKNKFKSRDTILVSKDINLRIRARAYGLIANDYEKDKLSGLELFAGFQAIKNEIAGTMLQQAGNIDFNQYGIDVKPNECVSFLDQSGKEISIGRRMGDRIRSIGNQTPWQLEPRNREQSFAINMLLDQRVPLVTLIGKAGTGKTLVAIASALEMTLERKRYNKMVIYRPIQPVGNDVGYLPGTLEEKLEPWMGAIMDSLEFLFEQKSKDKWKTIFDLHTEKGRLEMQALTHIRGRSIPNSFILVDEAQNLSKEEVKTILTRAGQGTKIVLTGDIEQIDNSYLDAMNNGLTYVVEKFKNSELAGHITFSRGERSPLASEAAEIL